MKIINLCIYVFYLICISLDNVKGTIVQSGNHYYQLLTSFQVNSASAPSLGSSPVVLSCQQACSYVLNGGSTSQYASYSGSIYSSNVTDTCYTSVYQGSCTIHTDIYSTCTGYTDASNCVSAYVADTNCPTQINYCYQQLTDPTVSPTFIPTMKPSAPTGQPSRQPTNWPTRQPVNSPSSQPASFPTCQPTRQPISNPTCQPTRQPFQQPSSQPTRQPTMQPSTQPSVNPTSPSVQPSRQPTMQPSRQPINHPTSQPTMRPSCQPSVQPSEQPTARPSRIPSSKPSAQPFKSPSTKPSVQPTSKPSRQPSTTPSSIPSCQPTRQPSMQPSVQPSRRPSAQPSSQPSSRPSGQPSRQPSWQPSQQPSSRPSGQPSKQPSMQPTRQPSGQPSGRPSGQPSRRPTCQPSVQPSSRPSGQPSEQPSSQPSGQPSAYPSGQPSIQPSLQPSSEPSSRPSGQPSIQPSFNPSAQPTQQPSADPTCQPSMQPSSIPTFPAFEAYLYTVSARYDALGMQVIIELNEMTNQAEYVTAFPCSRLIEFPMVDDYDCTWQDRRTIIVMPRLSYTALALDTIILLKNHSASSHSDSLTKHSLQYHCAYPICPLQTKIFSYRFVRLQPPYQPLLPLVKIDSIQPVIDLSCSDWLLDVSGSYGAGAKNWTKIAIIVENTAQNESNAKEIEKYLLAKWDMIMPMIIPRTKVLLHVNYTISITLCNFLGYCGQENLTVHTTAGSATSADDSSSIAIAPFVTILGSRKRTIYTNATFSLVSNAYVMECDNQQRTADLVYSWHISQTNSDNEYNNSDNNSNNNRYNNKQIASMSKDPTIFLLAAYTLQPGVKYIITCSVQDTVTGLVSNSSMIVDVMIAQELVPILLASSSSNVGSSSSSGSSSSVQYLPIGYKLYLDASQSFHPDRTLTESQASFLYTWSCSIHEIYQLPTTASGAYANYQGNLSCSHYLAMNTTNTKNSSLEVIANPHTPINSTFFLYVIITDLNSTVLDSRYNPANTSIAITILDRHQPFVMLTMAERDVSSLNPSQQVALTASISTSSSISCPARWLIDDIDLDIHEIALGGSEVASIATSQRNIVATLYLAANSLQSSSKYTFTITCNAGIVQSASHSLAIASASASILLSMNIPPYAGRLTGIEFSSSFLLSTSGWNAWTWPLSYQFGFVVPSTGQALVIHAASPLAYATTILAAPGNASSNSSNSSYNSNNNNNNNTFVIVQDAIGASTTSYATVQVISQQDQVSSYIASVVDTLAISGKKLAAKSLQQAITGASMAISSSSSSSSSSNSSSSNSTQHSANYTQIIVQGQRYTLLDSLGTLISLQNAGSLSDVISNINCIQVIIGTATEVLTSNSVNLAHAVIGQLLDQSDGISISSQTPAVLAPLLTPIDNLFAYTSTKGSQVYVTGKQLDVNYSEPIEENNYYIDNLSNVSRSIQALQARFRTLLVPSGASQKYATSHVRLANAAYQLRYQVGNISLAVPPAPTIASSSNDSSNQQLQQNVSTAQVIIVPTATTSSSNVSSTSSSSSSSTTSVYLQLTEYSNTTWLNHTHRAQLYSHVVTITTNWYDPFYIKLPLLDTSIVDTLAQRLNESIIVQHCYINQPGIYSMTCPGSQQLRRYVCNGTAVAVNVYCPLYQMICNPIDILTQTILVADQQSSIDANYTAAASLPTCTVSEVTADALYCRCSLPALPATERRLATKSSSSSSSSTTNQVADQSGAMTIAAMTVYVGQDFDNSFKTAGSFDTPSAFSSVILIIMMFSAMWGLGLLFMGVTFYRSYQREEQEKKAKKDKQQKLNDSVNNNNNINDNNSVKNEAIVAANSSRGSFVNRLSVRTSILFNSIRKVSDGVNSKRGGLITPTAADAGEKEDERIKIRYQLIKYCERIIPSIFQPQPLLLSVKNELVRHHLYVNLLFGGVSEKKPWLSMLQVLTIQTLFMFLMAVLFDLQSPDDDGTCITNITQATCLVRRSILDNKKPYCQWIYYPENVQYICIYNTPDFTVQTAFYCTIIITVFTAILLRPIDLAFQMLSAKSREEIVRDRIANFAYSVQNAARTVVRRLSTLGTATGTGTGSGSAAGSIIVPSTSMIHARVAHDQAELMIDKSRFVPATIVDTHRITRRFLHNMHVDIASSSQQQIKKYEGRSDRIRQRRSATLMTGVGNGLGLDGGSGLQATQLAVIRPASHTASISAAGTVNSNNKQDGSRSSFMTSLRNVAGRTSILPVSKPAMLTAAVSIEELEKEVQQEMTQFALEYQEQYQRLTSEKQRQVFVEEWSFLVEPQAADTAIAVTTIKSIPNLHDFLLTSKQTAHDLAEEIAVLPFDEAGMEIIYQFILDLLGRSTQTATIFTNKFNVDFTTLPVVSERRKWVLYVAIFGANIFFIYYSMLKGYNRGRDWQATYVIACVTQFLTEVLLFTTLECLWLNVLIPSLVTSQVRTIQQDIVRAVNYASEHSMQHIQQQQQQQQQQSKKELSKKELSKKEQGQGKGEEEQEKDVILNAGDYFYLSHRLAKVLPKEMMEVMIVLSYRSYLPLGFKATWQERYPIQQDKVTAQADKIAAIGQQQSSADQQQSSADQQQQPSHANSQGSSSGSRSLYACLLIILPAYLLQMSYSLTMMIALLPFEIQGILVRFVEPLLLGGLILLYELAKGQQEVLIIVLIIASLLLVSLLYLGYRAVIYLRERNSRLAREVAKKAEEMELIKVDDDDEDDEETDEDAASAEEAEEKKAEEEEDSSNSSNCSNEEADKGKDQDKLQNQAMIKKAHQHSHRSHDDKEDDEEDSHSHPLDLFWESLSLSDHDNNDDVNENSEISNLIQSFSASEDAGEEEDAAEDAGQRLLVARLSLESAADSLFDDLGSNLDDEGEYDEEVEEDDLSKPLTPSTVYIVEKTKKNKKKKIAGAAYLPASEVDDDDDDVSSSAFDLSVEAEEKDEEKGVDDEEDEDDDYYSFTLSNEDNEEEEEEEEVGEKDKKRAKVASVAVKKKKSNSLPSSPGSDDEDDGHGLHNHHYNNLDSDDDDDHDNSKHSLKQPSSSSGGSIDDDDDLHPGHHHPHHHHHKHHHHPAK